MICMDAAELFEIPDPADWMPQSLQRQQTCIRSKALSCMIRLEQTIQNKVFKIIKLVQDFWAILVITFSKSVSFLSTFLQSIHNLIKYNIMIMYLPIYLWKTIILKKKTCFFLF